MRTTLDGLRRSIGASTASWPPRAAQQHHEIGTMKAQLPWALEAADLALRHTAGLDWTPAPPWHRWAWGRASAPRPPLTSRSWWRKSPEAAQPGHHIVCMSNGAFGGIHSAPVKRWPPKRSHNRPRQRPAKKPRAPEVPGLCDRIHKLLVSVGTAKEADLRSVT